MGCRCRAKGCGFFCLPGRVRGALFPKQPQALGRVKTSMVVDKIVCSDMVLTIETSKPGKLPLVFEIHDVTLHDVGTGKPFLFEASLVNPKPVGEIRSTDLKTAAQEK